MITEQIKVIVKNSLEYINLPDVVFGVMASPRKVNIIDGRTLEEPFLIIPQHLTKYKVKQKDVETGYIREVEIDNSLKAGDKVILIKALGGQRYIVMDRYGGEE